RRLGFGAKLCIHPKQVDAVNRSFSPSAADIAWAQRVLAAAQASQGAAVALDGRMIDTPVILHAQAVLRERRGVAGG
ncbi:MAG TPA: CoA ester lyase, partial [Burkholderiaceae bacterium]